MLKIKFVQIAATNDNSNGVVWIYALDENGEVWRRGDHQGRWTRLESPEA